MNTAAPSPARSEHGFIALPRWRPKCARAAVSCAALLTFCFALSTASAQLFALDSNRTIYMLDVNTGARVAVGTVSANAGTVAGLAYDRANNIVYLTSSSNDSVYTLNLQTGAATLIGSYGDAAIVMHGLEYDDSTGILYGVSSHNGGLYNISLTNGAATLAGSTGLASFTNLGYNTDTNVMYATNGGTDSFYTINRTTGNATFVGLLNGPTNPHGLAYNRDNGKLYLIDSGTDGLYTIDTTTGAASLIGLPGSGNYLGLVYVPIPEPGSFLLLGLGGAGLLALQRLKRRRRA